LVGRYKRKNNDLIYTHSLSLKQAINCEPANITTLDGRILLVPLDFIAGQKTIKKIEGEGMPILENNKLERD
jgi:DnaJ-class molecular chaperone